MAEEEAVEVKKKKWGVKIKVGSANASFSCDSVEKKLAPMLFYLCSAVFLQL